MTRKRSNGGSEIYASCEREAAWCTPLAAAVIANKADSVWRLLARGANPAVTAPDGRTLDDFAREKGRETVAQVISEYRGGQWRPGEPTAG